MAPVILNDEGIPIGSYWGKGGPSRDTILLDGLRDRSDFRNGLEFVIAGIGVDIKITGMLRANSSDCPELPPDMQGAVDHDHDWQDAWLLLGYVPEHAVGVRAIYSGFTRSGRYDLWDQFTRTYGCQGACKDLAQYFFSDSDDGTAEAAQSRAMHHMASGTSLIGGLKPRCPECWAYYKKLRLSVRVPA